MIYARPSESITTTIDGLASGQVGTLGIRIIDATTGASALARTTSGIIELGGGIYRASLIAPATAGDYIIAWDTGGPWFTEDLSVGGAMPAPIPDAPVWAPTVADVGALLRARTKDANGAEVGTFTAATRPTGDEVATLILNGCAAVAVVAGWELPVELQPQARNLAAINTACQIEEGYWPEQVNSDRSPWQQLWTRYTAGLDQFAEQVAVLAPDGAVGARQGSLYTPTAAAAARWADRALDLSDPVDAALQMQVDLARAHAALQPTSRDVAIPGLLPGVQQLAPGARPPGRVFDRIAWRNPIFAKRRRR